MKSPKLPSVLALMAAISATWAGEILIDVDVNTFRDDQLTAENLSSPGTLTGGGTAERGGSPTESLNTYTIKGLDFTSIGGTANESITFTVHFSATRNGTPSAITYKPWGAVTAKASLEPSDAFTATLESISSSFTKGKVSFVGFTNVQISALNGNESAEVTRDGDPIIATGSAKSPATDIAMDPSSFWTVTPSVGAMNIGGFDLRIKAASGK